MTSANDALTSATGRLLCGLAVLLAPNLLVPPVLAETIYRDALIKDVPHVQQKPDFCGEACAEMALRKLGHEMDQDYVFNQSNVEPAEGRGCYTPELVATLTGIGLKVGTVWFRSRAENLDKELETQWRALHEDLLKGIPSIVCTHFDDKPTTSEHFRLILGYDAGKDEVIYHEPAEKEGAYVRMSRAKFLKIWPLKINRENWTIIRIRCEPDKIKQFSRPAGFTKADYARHVRDLREKIPAGGRFTVLVQPPFVVIGDERADIVRRRARQTVEWAVTMLKKDYFSKDPDRILDIWLFKDKDSYETNCSDLLEEHPTTPYGFCSSRTGALIMNIATGGGTLVHEIVHPFIKANFPECPAWLNEGLGSLYEQSSEADGHICGLTNWRLAGLQEAIKNKSVLSFEKLTGTTTSEFYGDDRGSNYAQARYLCYYLQQKGLLFKFYKEFLANHRKDPTGYKTLTKVLGEDDMAAFQKKWEKFVMGLTFP